MKRILVVVDMQNDFTTGPLGNAECAAVIPMYRMLGSRVWSQVEPGSGDH